MALFLCFFLIFFHHVGGFFTASPLQLANMTSRLNLNCSSDFGETDLFTGCEYCVYEFYNNGTDFTIYHDCIYVTNTYRLLSRRCSGFTSSTDVGYGLCDALPFETYDINLLCICATDQCNQDFTTCKQSVDQNPKLPPLPPLTNSSSIIACEDTPFGLFNSTYYCYRDASPYINATGCEDYVLAHTVACMYLESDSGNYLTYSALPDEDFDYVMASAIYLVQQMIGAPSTYVYYNESSSVFYVQVSQPPEIVVEDNPNSTLISNRCYCLTSDCNFNLTACLTANQIPSSAMKNAGQRLWFLLPVLLILI